MKTLQILLILSIISSCFTQDDECTTQFETILQQKCNSILTSTCRFTDNLSQRCLPKNTCESAQSRDSCIKTIPEDFHKKNVFGIPQKQILNVKKLTKNVQIIIKMSILIKFQAMFVVI